MSTENNVQKAIYHSMLTEKDAMDFYRTASQYVKNPDAKNMLELLAQVTASAARSTSMNLSSWSIQAPLPTPPGFRS